MCNKFFQTNFSFFKINPKRIKVRKSHFLTKLRKELFYACVEEANYKTIVKFTLNFLLVQLLVVLLSYPRSFNVKAAIVKNSETRPGTKANHFLLSYLSRFSTWKVLKPRLGFPKRALALLHRKTYPNLRWWYPWPCKRACKALLSVMKKLSTWTKMPTKSVLRCVLNSSQLETVERNWMWHLHARNVRMKGLAMPSCAFLNDNAALLHTARNNCKIHTKLYKL